MGPARFHCATLLLTDNFFKYLITHLTCLPLVAVHDILGSSSTRVFETRTATGSELFSLSTCLHTTPFALPSIFSPLEMLGIKIWETPLSQHARCPLPVVVRVSKTCALKLPINVLSCLKIPSCFYEICPPDFPIIASCFKKRRVVLVQQFIITGGFESAFVYKERQKKAQKCPNALRPLTGRGYFGRNPCSDSCTVFESFYIACICERSRGRVVKAMDQKSIGVSPRRFESCRLRCTIIFFLFVCEFELEGHRSPHCHWKS